MEESPSQKIEIDVENKKNDSDIQIEDTEEDLEDAISSIKKSSVATSLIIIIFAATLSLYEINSFLEILNIFGSFEGLLANNLFIIVKYGSGNYIEYIGNYKVNHDSYGNIYSIGNHKCHY